MDKYLNNGQNNEEINIFLEECGEILDNFDALLVEYEKNKNPDIITKLRRNAHSIKGSAGIVGLTEIQKKAHEIENLISILQNSPDSNNKETVDLILGLTAEINFLINKTKKNKSKSEKELLDELIKNITKLKNDLKVTAEIYPLINDLLRYELPEECTEILNIISKIVHSADGAYRLRDKSLINILSGSLKTMKKIIVNDENPKQLILINQKLMLTYQMIDGYVEKTAPENEPIKEDNKQFQRKKPEINVLDNFEQSAFRTLRVETSKIDVFYKNFQSLEKDVYRLNRDLDNTNNAFKQIAEKVFDFEVVLNAMLSDAEKNKPNLVKMQNGINDIQHILKTFEKYSIDDKRDEKNILDKINEIKHAIRNIRILPIGVILHMFPRMVRDIAGSLSKEVEIEITGGQISVDKSIIEEIKIPIIHILRNAVDHGIESPEEREKIGKPRAGKIVISVVSIGERVIISVKDDGRGIDINKIKTKAIKDKIIDKSTVPDLSEQDYLNIILRPGFSTKEVVSEISGRGMGLDIVNSKVSELNGNIKIITEFGAGTEIILDLPIDNSIIFDNEEINETKKLKNKTIVVVDDSRTTRMYFAKILEEDGYNCITFEYAEEALEKLKTINCDLIISDIEMPKMNGYEFISRLQKRNRTKDIPIVVISMLKEDLAKDKFRKNNIAAFINKSDFNKSLLLDIISENLK